MVLLLFGPPGCGKGTQAARITRVLGIPSISTGNLLRAEIEADTPLGREASAIIKRGKLVGDGLVNEMLAHRLLHSDCAAGFLLDGYPRTLAQASFLDGLLSSRGLPEPVVIHLEVPHQVLVSRLSSRRQCPACGRTYNRDGVCDDCANLLVQRPDDHEDVIRRRLHTYNEQTDPVVGFYQHGMYHLIDANRPPDDVFHEVEHVLEGVLVRAARTR